MFCRLNHSLLLIYAHHGGSYLRYIDNDHVIFHHYLYLHAVMISLVNKRLLTALPCSITLSWHHSLKGTLN